MFRVLFPLALLLSFVFSLNGCTNIAGATSSEPIELNPGKRTFGARVDDNQIEAVAKVNIGKAHELLKSSPVQVDSYNSVVLLTGQVPNAELRELAGRTVTKILGVRQVHNELQVAEPLPMLRRTKDTWLSTKVKTKLLTSPDVEGGRIRVITEDGAVYLMGLVSRAEADRVTDIVRHTGGADKVVRVFEYID